jgi:hypothetical protein
MSDYFRFFPTIEYKKFLAKDITRNVRMSRQTKDNASLYHEYGMKEGDTARTLAGKYYDSENLDWLVYFANDVIDPYYDCHLSQLEFGEYIDRKYGSFTDANRKIAGWINDWASDDGQISMGVYDALPSKLKKYYDPVVDYNRNLTSYKRASADISTNTNRIIKWSLDAVIDGSSGDLIDVYADGVKIGTAELAVADEKTVTAIHLILTSASSPTHIDVGVTDTLVAITDVLFDHKAIADDEIPFWRPVTCYEAEEIANEAKKNLRLISNQFAGEFKRQLKDKLQ